MLNYNDLPVEALVWSVIEPSRCHHDFITYVKQFPRASQERRNNAMNRACELHSFDHAHPFLYPLAYAALQEIGRDATDPGTRRHVLFHLGKMAQQGFGIDRNPDLGVSYYEQAIELGEVRSLVNLGIHYQFSDQSAEGKNRALSLFKKAAELGEPKSLVCMADLIEDETSPEKSNLVEQSIELGCAFAMARLASYYRNGTGGKPKDADQAEAWIIRSAHAGIAESNFMIGSAFEHGIGRQVQPQIAVQWYREGAAQLEPRSMAALGVMMLYGVGVEQDCQKGKDLLLKASLLGDSSAQRRLAQELLWATEMQQDHVNGYRWLKLAADGGNLKACENLYYVYMQGRGTDKDPENALFYVRQAAIEGLPDAQWQLAVAHWFDGDGIEENHDETFKWLSICAIQGDARGICFLGHAYLEGIGCDPDPQEAARLYAESAKLGYAPAIQALGRCYFSGEGVAKDPAKGMMLLRDAANRGESRAMTDIGLALANGEHVLTNFEEAMKWFLRAADQGDRNAMYYIGRMYEEGDGVEQNHEEARRWTAMAAAKGHQRALLWIQEHTPEKPEWLTEMITSATQVNRH
jgi:TPR repeat protein